MTTTFTIHRQRAHDLAAEPLETPKKPEQPVKPCAHQSASIEDLVDLVLETKAGLSEALLRRVRRGAVILLTALRPFDGDGWAARWDAFETTLEHTGAAQSELPVEPDVREQVITAVVPLIQLDVIRPSHQWMSRSKLRFTEISLWRDPDDTAVLRERLETFDIRAVSVSKVVRLACRIMGTTGKQLREITAEDLLQFTDEVTTEAYKSGIGSLWRALHQLGWIEHPSTKLPPRRQRQGQLSCEELVDFHGVTGQHREVLIEYLKHRTAGLDYPSRKSLARNLLKHFWCDMITHHPELVDQPSFAVTREQAAAWRERIKFNADGSPRRDPYPIMFTVRGFYLDIAQWALQDSYWAPWVAPSPIYSHEMKGYNKVRRAWTARGHQRTRELAPLLPKLVERAETDRREAAAALAAALDAGPGVSVTFRDEEWEVFQSEPTAPIRLRRENAEGSEEVNLTQLESDTFWSWAIIETLRQTGVRHEELLELTHLAIQPYKIPSTGETIPLVHVVPSKTDQERLIVASPELVHVLAQIVARLREPDGSMPLTQRWDPHEKVLGPLLPHLFVTRRGRDIRAMSPNTVAKHIASVARKVESSHTGEPVHFTPHDLRRIFATDALSSGLPPHIVQVLMGHNSLATTMGYAAIYPQDVIRHHRTFITQRRKVRPTEEYREPTAAEWEEFEAHFVTRKVSLGSCGRAYGTSCHHEHACVRCALLRPDPAQLDRLLEIIANLKDRITEAKEQGWLGEVEGLQISLTGAQHKLAQMQQQMADPDEPVVLGLPRTRTERGATR